ncbi:Uncharacterised protein [Vibrio cholerae]|nr:Uncharacterised protein [Vibrio cholerae]
MQNLRFGKLRCFLRKIRIFNPTFRRFHVLLNIRQVTDAVTESVLFSTEVSSLRIDVF